MRARILIATGLLLAGAVAARAQSPQTPQNATLDRTDCIPREQNGVVRATLPALTTGQSPRLYFRWREHEDFYWVALEAEPANRFWAIPPKPERRNEQVEVYAAVVDAAGRVAARSEPQIVKVTDDCKVRLGEKERGVAENLTVGETSAKQQGQKVLAFLCDGVVTRVNHAGIRRSDEVCRACVIAWWQRKAILIPAALTGVGVIVADSPEPSPSRP
ncbi:MAG TPA: hypothetical protein VFC23_02155 [Thermoanaerobaculia bacterium]|nr:hypothetical protein [Thermoanaerobaculia bacterium]